MEEPEQAPISIAGLVNFGNTSYVNSLLQALASCPAFVQYAEMLFQSVVRSRTLVPLGNGRLGTPAIQAVADALIRLQPQPGIHDLTGTASALAVLHAMIAHQKDMFRLTGVQQDVREALEAVLSVLQTETSSWLQLQRRPLTLGTKCKCRIPWFVDAPLWNPILDVPVLKNTTQGARTITADDMGDLQTRLNREQGPCNGLVAENLLCKFCRHSYSTRLTEISSLVLPVPSGIGSEGESRVSSETRLEDCLSLYCAEQGAEPVVCPRCSLRMTIERVDNKRRKFTSKQPPNSAEKTQHAREVSWPERILGWLGWTWAPVVKTDDPPSRSSSFTSTSSVVQTRGLAEVLEDDTGMSCSSGSLTHLRSLAGSRLSAWSVTELGTSTQGTNKPVSDGSQRVKGGVDMSNSAFRTPSPNYQEFSAPSSPSSWSGVGGYGLNSEALDCSQAQSHCGGAYRLPLTFDIRQFEKEGCKELSEGNTLNTDVISRANSVLKNKSRLTDSVVEAFKRELKEANIPWQDVEKPTVSKTFIGRLPEVLPIYLDRTSTKPGLKTTQCEIRVPKILDMSEFTQMPNSKGYIYHLMAMVIRTGDETDGHYLTARRVLGSEFDNLWFLASDEDIQQVSEQDVMNLEPCMLLYERENMF